MICSLQRSVHSEPDAAILTERLPRLVSAQRSAQPRALKQTSPLSLACHETSPCLDLGLELGGASCPPPRDLSVGHTLPGGKFLLSVALLLPYADSMSVPLCLSCRRERIVTGPVESQAGEKSQTCNI